LHGGGGANTSSVIISTTKKTATDVIDIFSSDQFRDVQVALEKVSKHQGKIVTRQHFSKNFS
jgi:hypothetical protein